MIHEVSAGTYGKATEMKAAMKDIERANKRILTNFAKDTGHTYEELKAELKSRTNADWYLSAEEAKVFGIIDHIEIPRVMTEYPQTSISVLPKAPLEIKVSFSNDGQQQAKPAKKRKKKRQP
jgi:hypothetical protein